MRTPFGDAHLLCDVRVSVLGLTKRADGHRQVMYAGHPLYTFVGDRKPGQTAGEGLNEFGGRWNALDSSGRRVEAGAPASRGSGGGNGPGGGGYGSGW